ncbi:hypothetical protein HK103_006803 [Boothiomyces macroporosus]|uniref:Translation machinery-associated protein 20 n=1 Tax=Boothiomyces macroporosus TaxID=261099 RepID=A0AAD5UD37_9FUNG|nr:hypothetical protein HK103_006803 [Boothiomyces macroporosus]
MFKKFNPKQDISGQTQAKSSVQRNIRAKILDQMPLLEPHIEEILPKKAPLFIVKCLDRVSILQINGESLFFQHFDGPFIPNLKLLQKYPDILPKIQVDRGAIKFVLKGADIMCPGVTSKGGNMPDGLEKDQLVCVMAEGKQHALAVGLLSMSSQEIKTVNKGIGILNMHYLNDGLWATLK